MPPLVLIHADSMWLSGLPKRALDHWRKKSTAQIVASLAPGEPEALRCKTDGRVMNGNTRVKILAERLLDVNSLPREVVSP